LCLDRHFERLEPGGETLLPLREYPVREVMAVHADGVLNGDMVEPDCYRLLPEQEEAGEAPVDIPSYLSISPAPLRAGCSALNVIYRSGYGHGEVPPDLASACLELAAWNLSRYRGRRMELSMPENVRSLLEPYRRKTIEVAVAKLKFCNSLA
jgi:hypothetical protein